MKENKEGGNLFIYFCIYPRGWKIYSNVAPPISFPYRNHCWNNLFRKSNDRRGDNRSDDSARKAIEIVGKTALFEIDGGIVRTVKW